MPTKSGLPAPDFALPATGGGTVRLSALHGTPVVLYFYPRDDTPGCTQEGKDFKGLFDDFTTLGARILGVSRDPLGRHERFKAKYDFPFALLADPGEAACRAYGVLKEKSLYGRKYIGIERSTFLIDAQGTLRSEWRGAKVTGHAAEVLDALRAL